VYTVNLLCSMDNHSQQLHSGQLQAIVADVVTRHRRLLFLLALVMAQIAQLCYQIFAPTTRIPHHTSILSGEAWVLELITGHPNRIKINFGISIETFSALVRILHENSFVVSKKGILVEEQLGIFLYTCVTGLSSRLVAEQFQRSTDTITKYVAFTHLLFLVVTWSLLPGTSRSLYISSPPPIFTTLKSTSPHHIHQYWTRSPRTLVSNFLTNASALWMVPTYVHLHQQMTTLSCITIRAISHRIASSLVISVLISSMRCVGGMGQFLTVHYGRMLYKMASRYLLIGISLVMPDSHRAIHFSFHIVVSAII